jgi:hypothetical protein
MSRVPVYFGVLQGKTFHQSNRFLPETEFICTMNQLHSNPPETHIPMA